MIPIVLSIMVTSEKQHHKGLFNVCLTFLRIAYCFSGQKNNNEKNANKTSQIFSMIMCFYSHKKNK